MRCVNLSDKIRPMTSRGGEYVQLPVLPAVTLSKEKAVFLDIEDILYFERSKHKILIHTQNEVFITPTSLDDFYKLLRIFGFEQLEKSNIVNMAKVVSYDFPIKSVRFGVDDFNSKYAYVSRENKRKIKHLTK